MTASPRHENSVGRIRKLAKGIGATIWINTQNGGKDGYQLPAMLCDDNKLRPFIVDCLVRLKSGAMVAFEVDFHHETSERKKIMLWRCGIVTVPVSPGGVDLWESDPPLFESEIAYHLKQSAKLEQYARMMA